MQFCNSWKITTSLFIMSPNSLSPMMLSCIFLVFLLNSFLFCSTDARNPSHQQLAPMDFPLLGSRKGSSVKGLSQLKKYLSNLGYMEMINNSSTHEDNDLFNDTLEQAIKKYKYFFNLPANGVLDANTIAKMRQPRCGVPDFPITDEKYVVNSDHEQKHQQRMIIASHYAFFPGNPKWPRTKRNLTYSFAPGTRTDVNMAILGATNIWASVSPFKFKYTPNYDQADIKISFQRLDHGDGTPFDGDGGVVAHAFSPTDGRLHYDADEKWVDGVKPGLLDLQTIGLHELGHILGLDHTTDAGAIMYPISEVGKRKGLGQDDINGIKALYPS